MSIRHSQMNIQRSSIALDLTGDEPHESQACAAFYKLTRRIFFDTLDTQMASLPRKIKKGN